MADPGEISFQDAMQPAPAAAVPPNASGAPDAQPQPGEIPFDQAMLPAGNTDQDQPSSSAVGAFARGVATSALPTLAGGAAGEAAARGGALAGAEFGAPAGPIGAVAGGVLGGLGGGYLASLGQDAVLDALGLREGTGLLSRAQQVADEQQHPYASEAGSLLDTLLSFGVAGEGATKLSRALGGAIMGGVQTAQDANNGTFDPTKTALAVAAGALTGRPRDWVQNVGDRAEAAIAALKGTGTGAIQSARATQPGTPGRPDLAGTPAPEADKSDIEVANDITTTAPGVAADNPAVPEISGAGNPVGAPMVAREAAKPGDPGRDYGKTNLPPETGIETAPSTPGVSTDPIALDIQAAIQGQQAPPPATTGLETNEPPLLATGAQQPGHIPGAANPDAGILNTSQMQREAAARAQANGKQGQEGEAFNDERNQAIVSAVGQPPEGTVPVRLGSNTVVSQTEPLHVPPHVAWVLQHPDFQAVLNQSRVNRTGHVPYVAGADANSPITHIDQSIPRVAVLPSGRQFNTADPMILHEQIEKWVMDRLTAAGMEDGPAYKVAHWGFAEPLEDAWYRSRGIDPAEAEKWWAQHTAGIQNAAIKNIPEGLYQKPYPHDSVSNAHEGGITTQKPSADELAQAHKILNEQPVTPAVGEQPTTGEAPAQEALAEPKPLELAQQQFVDRMIASLRKINYNDAADKIEALSPDKQYEAAQKLERMTRGQTGRRPAVAGGVQARSQADAQRKQGALDKMKAAVQQFAPEQPGFVPLSVPDKQAMLTRLHNLVQAATGGRNPSTIYRPNVKPPEWQLVKQAYNLINGKRPSAKAFADYAAAEKLLLEGGSAAAKDVQQTARIERDIGRRATPSTEDLSESGVLSDMGRRAEWRAAHTGRVEYPPFDNSDEGESQVYVNQQNKMRNWLNELPDEDYSLLADAHPELEQNIEATQDPAALHAQLQQDLTEAQAGQIKAGRRQEITPETKPIVDTVKNFLGNESGLATAPSWLKSAMNPRGIFSPRADDATLSYADSMGSRFKQYRNTRQQLDTEILRSARKVSTEFPEMKNPTFYQPVYRSFEPDGDKIPLTARQQQLRDMLMPMYQKAIDAYDEIRTRRPDMQLPAASEGYIRHVQKGIHDWEPGSDDPILSIAKQSLNEQTSPLMDRTFFDLVSPTDNKRYLVSYTEDGGLTRWLNGKATKIRNADLPAQFHPGEVVGVGGHQFWIDHATVRDINQHARMVDKNGKVQQIAYMENPGYALAEGYRQVATALERIKMMDHWLGNANLNTAQEARGENEAPFPPSNEAMMYMAHKGSDKAKANPDWKESNLQQFHGWVMAKPLQDVVNDFVKPGLGGDAFQWMERANSRLTKLMFMSPVFHGYNVLQTWGTARGMRWLQPTAYREMFGQDMPRAIKSVSQQDSIQDRIMTAGGTLEYPALLNRNSLSQIADLFGLAVKNDMPKWERYVDPVYQASSKAMWFFNDVLMTHLFLEGTERLGLSDAAAVQRAHEIFPSYQVQQRLFGSRDLANFINDPRLSLFGRYRSGILKSYGDMFNALRSQQPAQASKAMGYLVGAAFTNMVIFGALDWLAKKVTGNSEATVGAHGLMTIPSAGLEALTGKASDMSYTKALQDIFSLAPIPHTVLDMWSNRNWIGKPIVQPQDLAALNGKPTGEAVKGLARAGIQGAEHVGASLISPMGQAETIGGRKGTNPVADVAKYMAGIKTPTPGSQRFEARKQGYDAAQQRARFKHPQGLVEQTYNEVFGQ